MIRHTLLARRDERQISVLLFLVIMISALCSAGGVMAQGARATTGAYAWVDGAHLWFQIRGHGDPVVVVPGGPGESHVYLTPWFDELAKNNKLIYFDPFGTGKSDRAKNPAEYSFDRDVRDLEGLRKALGIEKWSIIGHSYGGMVAQAFALKYPGAVQKLILSDTYYDAEMWQKDLDNCNYEIKNQFPEVWSRIAVLRDSGVVSGSPEYRKLYSELPAGFFSFYDPDNASKVKEDPRGFNAAEYNQIAGTDADFVAGGSIAGLDFRNELRNLKMPVLVIAGRFDRGSVPAFAEKFTEYCPQAKFVMFEKSGHFPFVEETKEYFRDVEEFLKNGK